MTERIWFLKRCNLFESLSLEDIGELEACCRVRTFPRKSLVYAPDDRAEGVLLLLRGRVCIHTITDEGKRAVLAFIEPGEVFGELAVLEAGTREEFAEACEESTLVFIPAEAFRRLMARSPEVSLAITKLIGLRRRRLERRLGSLLFRSHRARLVHALLDLAEEYGAKEARGEIALRIRLSHQDLANLIGSTRESVTIALGELQAEGYLRVGRRRITVRDLQGLAESVRNGRMNRNRSCPRV